MPAELALPLAIFLVFLNGFFVAAEFALVKIRPTKIEELVARGSRTATMAQHAVKHLDAYLSATQLGITLSSIGLGWIGEPAFARILEPLLSRWELPEQTLHIVAFAFAFFTITLLHVVIGELMPKSWAIQQSERVSMAVAFPLHWFYILFLPLIALLNGLANRLLRIFGIHPASEHEVAHSQEEIDLILTASGRSGVLRQGDVDLVRHVFRFGQKTAADVMTPRVDMTVIRNTLSAREALTEVLSLPYSRFPVVGENADDVKGMVHIRDLVRLHNEDEEDLEVAIREVIYVPESKPLHELLKEFQQTRTHLAIVRDEYGGTAGLVTLEDVIEQIVGAITDETDIVVTGIMREGTSWLVYGKVHIDDINDVIGSHFESTNFDSIGGFVSGLLGRPAKVGDTLSWERWRFEVVETDRRRIKVLRVSAE